MINLLTGLESTSSALNAERVRMDVVAQNIANANTSRGLDGKPYQRQQVVFESILKNQQALQAGGPLLGQGQSIISTRIEKDPHPPRQVYHPGHPDADANGMLSLPNINIHEEMVDMITTSRAFEANLAVMKNSRSMAMQALAIGKR